MDIIILLIITITTLGFGYISSKPIDTSRGFDISISQKSYQAKIDKYLREKWNKEEIPQFSARPVKNTELPKEKKTTEVRRSICWTIKPLLDYKTKKTYKFHGYLRFKDSGVYVHRWVMEKHLERRLRPEEVVHHIDGNKLNNDINNLMLFSSQKEHDNYHRECKRRYGTWYAYLPDYNEGVRYIRYN